MTCKRSLVRVQCRPPHTQIDPDDILRAGHILLVAGEEGTGKSYSVSGELGIRLALGGGEWAGVYAVSVNPPSLYAARVDLRALVEVAVLTRWLEDDPELRARLWAAEDERSKLKGRRLGKDFSQRRGSAAPHEVTDAERAEIAREIGEARAAGRAAGLAIPREGRVLPTIESMMESVGDLTEARFLYWVLSPFAHAGGRSFVGDDLEEVDGQTYLAHRPGALASSAALLGWGYPPCSSRGPVSADKSA